MKFQVSSLVYFEPENIMSNKYFLTAWHNEQEKVVCAPSD